MTATRDRRVWTKEYRKRPHVRAARRVDDKLRKRRMRATSAGDAATKRASAKWYRNGGFGWFLKRKYGLTIEAWQALHDVAGGVCPLCQRRAELVVDHNHTTGMVRGLVCRWCNSTLGMVEKYPHLLDAFRHHLGL